MRLAKTLRNLSLGTAAASFLLAGSAFGLSEMAGGTARLDHTLDAQNARQGQRVEAKLDATLKTNAGLDLPKGTELIGAVTQVQASENGGPSSVSLIFTKAQMKDGKMIPVKVTLIGAYPSSAGGMEPYGEQTMPAPPRRVNPKEKIDQQAGLLSHVSMHAAAEGHNSATFRDKDGNLRLKAGTYFQVGVAPAGSGMMANGA